MEEYIDYLLEPEQASATPFDQIDSLLDDELGQILDEEHQFTTDELEREIQRCTETIQRKRQQIEAKQAKAKERIHAEQEKIKELEATWRSLKKEGYQPPAEKERMAQIRERIKRAEDRIQQWEDGARIRKKRCRSKLTNYILNQLTMSQNGGK